MKPDNLSGTLLEKFKLEPTQGQYDLFVNLERFLDDDSDERMVFVIKGYAGTGKTSFLNAFVNTVPKFGWKTVLLAPTGRAAKVMHGYTKRKSQTIHRKIYKQLESSVSGNLVFELQKNNYEDTIFIVDEASMVGDTREYGQNGLLRDLIQFVFSSTGNRLILIGDEAQLPPVGMDVSPALNINHLRNHYFCNVYHQTLTEVMRQETDSGILQNATAVRQLLETNPIDIQIQTKGYQDIFRMDSSRLEDGIRFAYEKYGQDNTLIVTKSNKRASMYNQLIRNQILFFESELEVGDVLMVVRNNYSVLDEGSEADFIANGDFVKVLRLGREEKIHEFRFQQVTLQLIDYEEEIFDTLIILEILYSNSPNLGIEEQKRLYESVQQDYFGIKSKTERKKKIREDRYLNALQVKFAYALTAHKAQGGQWDVVFIDQYYLVDGRPNQEMIRWLYTTLTRGVKMVFFVNFPASFFIV